MADDKGHGKGHDDGHGKKHKKHKGGHGGHGGGHHEEGVPEWMVSFADNVCLMMGFFVIMLALNMKPAQGGSGSDKKDGAAESAASSVNPALVDAAIAIRSAFNNPVDLESKKAEDQPLIKRIKEKKTGSGRSREDAPRGDSDAVQSIRPSDYYSLGGVVPFGDGSSDLSASARRTAADIAQHLRGPRFMIEVRGHVSAMEAEQNVGTAMRLSHQRAFAVAEALVAEGLPWERLRLVACGDNERVQGIAYDLKAHRSNQRVEVLVTREIMPDDPHLREQSPPDAPPPAPPEAFAKPLPKAADDKGEHGAKSEGKKDEAKKDGDAKKEGDAKKGDDAKDAKAGAKDKAKGGEKEKPKEGGGHH